MIREIEEEKRIVDVFKKKLEVKPIR